ncbi:MAG TPA: transketolase family protein [bacterium]|nr:transketolase family protein [bacterium]HQL61318.1 transketolase family protein [bacterium]
MAKASRLAFGETLAELGEKDEKIVVLDADLSKSTMSILFAKKFPDRFFECGIAESNMVGIAAGLALAGKKPFACSFACFLTGRYETIRMSVAYSNAPVRIVGTHAGIGIGEDGNSQMGLEDLALMRALPGMIVLQPCDELETKQAVTFMAEHNGYSYIRLTRQKLPDINSPDYRFQVGKGVVLADGKDLTIMATGSTVAEALEAGKVLQEKGIRARVVNIHTIKPIDKDLVARCAKETGRIFTVEDHNIMGGMGSAVAEAVCETHPVPVRRWGLLDKFGESGDPEELYAKYELDAAGIARQAAAFVQEK